MNWADLVVLILIGMIAAAEIKRGFGLALLTLVGAFVSLRLALLWSAPLARSLQLSAAPGPNRALVMGLAFVVMMALVTLIVYLIHPDTFLSLEPFDNLFGGLCGLATGWIVAFGFYQALHFWGAHDLLQASLFAPEIVRFETYHKILTWLHHLGEVQKTKYD